MSKPLTFQQVILKLHEFWSDNGCVIWAPYNIQVGAGTANPATLLRVLGREPWRVAYAEPSVRPDDGRFGDNPNRMQKYYQYQVILKPDPGNSQELYLKSLEYLGINPREHDIRFVEDNWESPALGAWGLGWEVWLDGQEITQFTYFQQAGGLELDPVSVEITYGIERIVLALQGKNSAWDIDWTEDIQYRDMMLQEEIDYCNYYFNIAGIDELKQTYDIYEKEFERGLEQNAVVPAYDYVLKCSHVFNVLDTRGAIGVTERATYFRRMRDMSRKIARAYVEQRERLEYPLDRLKERFSPQLATSVDAPQASDKPADFLLEIGVEEMPTQDVDGAYAQLTEQIPALLDELKLSHDGVSVMATPRRLVVHVKNLAERQPDETTVEKGPPANRAFDADGNPTKAAQGFARSRGVDVSELTVQEIDGGEYVTATVQHVGQPATVVLAEALPELIASIKFGKSMRWNATNVSFSRPLRWLVALFGDMVVPFVYAGVASGNVTRGIRPYDSPEQALVNIDAYYDFVKSQGIVLDLEKRRQTIVEQINKLASEVNGIVPENKGLLDEVLNLIEAPTALRGSFDEKYLELPREVLVTVMRKHQRYFPIETQDGRLLPYFITVRNGDAEHLDKVAHGNEHVLTARFSDADFFYREDVKKPLSEHLLRLQTLTFEEHLGSVYDKNQRIVKAVKGVGELLNVDASDIATAEKASEIVKADLATNMVVELTSLQGIMGREYALKEGYDKAVAYAISEHWQPRNADDSVPASTAGALLALTDRLDSLVGLFAVGLAPRSTADPYGLRRAALGVIQILIGKQLDVNLAEAVQYMAQFQPVEVSEEAQQQVLEFIHGRLQVWLQEQGWAVDVVKAVLNEQAHNPYHALIAIEQLSKWVERDDWTGVLDSFARCVRITRNEEEQFDVDVNLFQEPQENTLYKAYQTAYASLKDADNTVDTFLSVFVPMMPAVTKFFGENPGEGVLVHTDDLDIRHNRVGLLQRISALQKGIVDLSELSGF